MALPGIVHMVQQTLKRFITPGDLVVDATVGAGYDTLFLARLVGEKGHVYGFDIQEEALNRARANIKRGNDKNLETRITLFQKGHETLKESLPHEIHGAIKAVTFNLGYLPGSDSDLTTLADTSLSAIRSAMELIAPKGLLSIAIYSGHPQGKIEQERLKAWAKEIPYGDFRIASYEFINKSQNQETLLFIERSGR